MQKMLEIRQKEAAMKRKAINKKMKWLITEVKNYARK